MKKFLLLSLLMIVILFASCSKDPINPTDPTLIGIWECDSTVLDTVHSMFFKSKKYEFLESGEFERQYGVFGLWDFGTWDYHTHEQTIHLEIDSLYEEYPTLQEEITIYSISATNLILMEDYDSVYLENGELQFIKEYYTKKK